MGFTSGTRNESIKNVRNAQLHANKRAKPPIMKVKAVIFVITINILGLSN